MTDEKLKACPFCGGEGELYEPNDEIAVISCLKCNAESGYYNGEDSTTPDDAIKFWNTRADLIPAQRVTENRDVMEFLQNCANGIFTREGMINGAKTCLKLLGGE